MKLPILLIGFFAIASISTNAQEPENQSNCENENNESCSDYITRANKIINPKNSTSQKFNTKDKKWKFSVKTSLGGSSDQITKKYLGPNSNYRDNSANLDSIINTSFANYSERREAISSMCQGMSQDDRIHMASLLAGRLNSVYDWDRANSGAGVYISPEEQWNALQSRTPTGVCRDAALTVSHFLISCGFSPDQIDIEGYRTVGGGHQVVSITDDEGERHTINWSELFIIDQVAVGGNSPAPSIINSGIWYTIYDAETGEVIENRSTQLADALASLTGRSIDPNLLPNINSIEATNGEIALALFQIDTLNGDQANGISIFKSGQEKKKYGMNTYSIGIGIVQNTRDVQISSNQETTLKQNIIYMQLEDFRQFDISALKGKLGATELALIPSLGSDVQFYYAQNSAGGEKGNSFDSRVKFQLGTDLVAKALAGNLTALIGGFVNYEIMPFKTNSQSADERFGITPESIELHTGFELQGRIFKIRPNSKYIMGANSDTIVNTLNLKRDTSKNNSSGYLMSHSIYNFGEESESSFLYLGTQKSVGEIGNRGGSLNFNLGTSIPINQPTNYVERKPRVDIGIEVKF